MGRNKHRGKVNSIPEGWLGCPPMSTGFVDDRFIVFKTPLKSELNNKVPQADRFSIDSILHQLRQMNHSRIGLWIDLTNTTRYYDAAEIQNRGIQYEKVACEGRVVPSKRVISHFCNMVHHFFRGNRRDYVGVHCTHGFNRTGFLVCCYLIRFRNYTAQQAVMEFARHRQPGIYRQLLVDHLYTMTVPLEYPIRVTEPEWLKRSQPGFDWASNPRNNVDNRGSANTNVEHRPSTSTSSSDLNSSNSISYPKVGYSSENNDLETLQASSSTTSKTNNPQLLPNTLPELLVSSS